MNDYVEHLNRGRKYKAENMVGKRFGKLTVIKGERRYIKKQNKTRILWICKCDCGNIAIIERGNLLRPTKIKKKSCGCTKRYNDRTIAAKNKLYVSYKHNAKTRGISFALEKKEFLNLVLGDCYYCGAKPSMTFKCKTSKCFYNGIDRVDSHIGYQAGNVVTSCSFCNYAKHKHSQQHFYSWIKRVYNHLNDKGLLNELNS